MSLLLTLGLCLQSYGHSHHHPFAEEGMVQLYRDIIELSPELVDVDNAPKSEASMRVYGKRIQLNSSFWYLVRGWMKEYHKEIKKGCHHCELPSIEEGIEEAKALQAQGLLKTKFWQPIKNSGKHITEETVDLGATLGKPAFIAKITSEVAETILSKTAGGAGVHVLCNLIDVVIIFGTRYLQNSYRAPLLASQHYNSGFMSSLKVALISSGIRRAQKKVKFELGPVELSEEQAKSLDHNGPNRFWGWIKKGKRLAWIEKLTKKGQAQLKKKSYLGQRYKRSLFILARKRRTATFMNGKEWHFKTLSRPYLWVLSVQENIIDPSVQFHADANKEEIVKKYNNYRSSSDVLSNHIVNKYYEKQQSKSLKLPYFMASDILNIFDSEQSKRVRYALTLQLETLFINVLHNVQKSILSTSLERTHLTYNQKLKIRWHLGKIANYFYEYTDFLRVSAVQTDQTKLDRFKYSSIEVLFKTLRALNQFHALSTNPESLHPKKTAELVERLTSYSPWNPKKISYSIIPFRSLAPKCEKLVGVLQ